MTLFAAGLLSLVLALAGANLCNVSSPQDPTSLRIGFLSSFSYGQGKTIGGAIPLAVQHINQDDAILPNHTLEFQVGECGKPDSATCIRRMTDMKTEVHAFIGPDESCASEALVAAAWNKPLISYKCIDENLSNKNKYPTFARTVPPSSKISKSVISLLKYYRWSKVSVIVKGQQGANKQMEDSFLKLAQKSDIRISSTFYLPDNYTSSRYANYLSSIVIASSEKTRGKRLILVGSISHVASAVYILFADAIVRSDFVTRMGERKLLQDKIYVVISVEEEVSYSVKKSSYERNEHRIWQAHDLRGVLIITPSPPSNPKYTQFQNQVAQFNSKEPFKVPYHSRINIKVPTTAGLAYDAVLVLAKAFHKVITNEGDINNGLDVVEALKNLTYKSILGFNVHIDQNGEAEGNYTLLQMEVEAKGVNMKKVGAFLQTEDEVPVLNLLQSIAFYGNGIPRDEPECGFNNELCNDETTISVELVIALVLLVIISFICVYFVFKHYHYEYKLNTGLWKVDMKDLTMINTSSEYALQNIRNTVNIQGLKRINPGQAVISTNKMDSSRTSLPDLAESKSYSVAIYKGSVVFVKRLDKKSFDLTRNMRKELIQVHEMRHENINSFIGVCTEAPNVSILYHYCARGSLEDVIKNKDLDLDNMFVASLVADLIKGMIYLHDSEIISHGNLKPSNCLIDSRWVLQITDYGLHEFKTGQETWRYKSDGFTDGQDRYLLWKAPELLRKTDAPPRGSQKGDVYSFALILFEIVARTNPFEDILLQSSDILHRIMYPQLHGHLFRPSLEQLKCAGYISKCIEECWKEEPEERPDFRFINIRLREMQTGLKANIFDNMIAILEKYSYNLESVVQERTKQLSEEKKKTENLLLRMLPKSAAEQLKRGEAVEAEYFDCVTIYFSDIIGFTELSAISTPIQVVNLLNDLYTCFDSIIGNYDVYKVETIGDAYMVASGLPIRNSEKHASEIASMALHLLKQISHFKIAHRPGESLKLRIGIHSGPCVAGVVGLRMPRYCLFGDTVNVASRMESTGEAHKIHISYSCKQILEKLGGYKLEERGNIHIKGKGQMKTYWLLSKET